MDGLSCLIDRSRTKCTADGHEVRQSAADRDSSQPTGHTSCPYSPLRLCFFVGLTRKLFEESSFPMAVGDDLTYTYNDTCRIIAGERHPDALGRSTRRL